MEKLTIIKQISSASEALIVAFNVKGNKKAT